MGSGKGAAAFVAPRLGTASGIGELLGSGRPIMLSLVAVAAFLRGPTAIGSALMAVSTAVAATGLPVASSVFSPAAVPALANHSNGVIAACVRCLPDSLIGWKVIAPATECTTSAGSASVSPTALVAAAPRPASPATGSAAPCVIRLAAVSATGYTWPMAFTVLTAGASVSARPEGSFSSGTKPPAVFCDSGTNPRGRGSADWLKGTKAMASPYR